MAAFAALAFAGALETSPAAAWNADLFRVDMLECYTQEIRPY